METSFENDNKLMKRKELRLHLVSEKNPGFEEISKKISEKYSVPQDQIVVYSVKNSFGSNKFNVEAYIYNSKEDKEKMIVKTKKQRKEEKKALEEQKKNAAEVKA
jgi:ribosomal protein S24E